MKRLVVPLIFGVFGVAILTALGFWQLARLEWKTALLAEIESRISEEPTGLSPTPNPETDAYRTVRLSGQTIGEAVAVFGTWREAGAGYRLVAPFALTDRTILVDFGVAVSAEAALPSGELDIEGNLHWPNEIETSPDNEVWTKLDVAAMARKLGTEAVYVVARRVDGAPLQSDLVPLGTEGISNNHFGYAIQWFGLALVWAGMTAFLLWRMHSRTGKHEA